MHALLPISSPDRIVHYFWLLSDWAYLGGPRLESLGQRHGITIEHVPLNLPEVYAATGGVVLPLRSRERQNYRVDELKRWRRKLGMPCNIEPHVPDSDDVELASCCIIAAMREGIPAGGLANAFMRALWAEDKDICNPATVKRILMGFDDVTAPRRHRCAKVGL